MRTGRSPPRPPPRRRRPARGGSRRGRGWRRRLGFLGRLGYLLAAATLARGLARGLAACPAAAAQQPAAALLLGGLGLRSGPLDDLDQHHRGGVTLAGGELDDARVAALPVGEPWGDVGVELVDDVPVLDAGQGTPAGCERALLAHGDQALGDGAEAPGPGLGGA